MFVGVGTEWDVDQQVRGAFTLVALLVLRLGLEVVLRVGGSSEGLAELSGLSGWGRYAWNAGAVVAIVGSSLY